MRLAQVMCVDGPTRGMNNSRFGGGPSACRDPGRKAVVVQVTDSCPCVYPGNQASNSMWCCGDKFHLDLSYTARQRRHAAAAATHESVASRADAGLTCCAGF